MVESGAAALLSVDQVSHLGRFRVDVSDRVRGGFVELGRADRQPGHAVMCLRSGVGIAGQGAMSSRDLALVSTPIVTMMMTPSAAQPSMIEKMAETPPSAASTAPMISGEAMLAARFMLLATEVAQLRILVG